MPIETTDNLTSGIIPLAVDHKIDPKYPKLLWIPQTKIEHNTVQSSRKTILGKLQPIDVTDSKVNNFSWTTDATPAAD